MNNKNSELDRHLKIARLLLKIHRDGPATESVRDKMKDFKIKGVKVNDKIAGVSRNIHKLSDE
jgi:hypothetical protein